ncbi:MAG TPA: hypothetical protein ENN03_08535 [bacterium]|nr:hypothetical protein [bacterium]
MTKNQLELLVLYQDISMMLLEAEQEEKKAGFKLKGRESLEKARDDLGKRIETRLLRTFQRLNTRYIRVIAPVQDGTCLGCFARLPTSYEASGRSDQTIMTCEQCGRILYWIE